MSGADSNEPQRPARTVFLSYASQDREAAKLIRDALPGYGLEVWYDESDLTGGDAWDQKIRRQIRECDFFMPLISAQTDARHEGYFRREWRLAVERTLDMADDHPFLVPVVIDDTDQARARVPDRFLSVQWVRVPGGRANPALETLCRRLTADTAAPVEPVRQRAGSAPGMSTRRARRDYPEFPREEPGQRMRFGAHVAGWALQSGWIAFMRLPRWVRIIAYIWVAVLLLNRGCSSRDDSPDHVAPAHKISSAEAKKLKQIAQSYQGGANKADIARLGAQIARTFADEADTRADTPSPLLAIPFGAPSTDPVARKLADATFAQVYGRVSITHRGQVGLSDEPLSSLDAAAAVERGRARHATYVLYGAIDGQAAPGNLMVRISAVADGAVVWSGTYAAEGADPAHIADEVESKVPQLSKP